MGDDVTASDLSGMSVLAICNLPSYPGKVERHLVPLAALLKSLTVVHAERDESYPDETLGNIRFRQPAGQSTLVRRLLLLFITFQECYENEYDGIVTVSLVPYGIIGLVVGRLFRKPVHLRIIGADIAVYSRSWYRHVPLRLFPLFDSISVHGPAHKEFLVENGLKAEDIYILPGSIERDTYTQTDDTEKTYDFIWTGRMESHKRPELFVEALGVLAHRGYDFRAVMLGTGGLREEIDRRIAELQLTDVVDRPGWVDSPSNYYSDARIFVLTSEREGFGFPLVEAMASGTTCVAPRFSEPAAGNTSFIIDDGKTGVLVPEMSPEKIADELETLLRDESRRTELGTAARNATKRFTRDRMEQRWKNVIETFVES